MAKLQTTKSTSSKGNSILNTIGGLIALIVVLAGAALSIFTGGGNTPSATAIASVASPTPRTGVATVVSVTSAPTTSTGKVEIVSNIPKGFGAKKGFWEVYFTAPLDTTDRKQFVGGTDTVVAGIIDKAKNTLDIAAFEWNNEVMTAAALNAIKRGVVVRIVADNEHTIEDDDSTMAEMEAAGVKVTYDNRSALMHNKFMIVDSSIILTGSTNWTMNGVYRNYNNLLVFRGVPQAVKFYQAEFDEMYTKKLFGPKKTANKTTPFMAPGNIPMEIYFAAQDDVIGKINSYIKGAKKTIRFMAFSFTEDSMGQALLAAAQTGVNVQGVFERTGSTTDFSELKPLFCAGLDVRQDNYGGIMHHKVLIIDSQIVIAGSFNFSNNAVQSNDENLVIIKDADLAAQYLAEFARVQKISTPPTKVTCS